MFQPSPENKSCCYPLLVPGNMSKTIAKSTTASSSINDNGNLSNSGGVKSIDQKTMQHFGTDHSSSLSGNNFPRPQLFTAPSLNSDLIPRPIATLDKSPNFREYATSSSMNTFNLGSSNLMSSSMRGGYYAPSSGGGFGPLSTTLAPQPPASSPLMANVISQQHSTNTYPSAEQGPKLHFCKKQLKEQTCAELRSDPQFRLNDKTKHPPNTLFNVSIKDVLSVSGHFLNDCEMFLRLDNGSQHGSPVGSCFFKPVNPTSNIMGDTPNRLFRAKIDIPPSLNTKKGNTSSRVGFVEIHDSNNKMIAVSDKFWIRSRSRNQMVKDESTKKRIRMHQKTEPQKHPKQVFHDYSPSSPQSSSNTPYPSIDDQELQETLPKKPIALVLPQHANPLTGAPSTAFMGTAGSSGGSGFNYGSDQIQTSFSSSLLQQVPNDFSPDFWSARNLDHHNSLSSGPSFSFLDKEMSNASSSRPPATSTSWNSQSEPLKTLEHLVRNQQQRIEELSCLIANNAKLIHTLQMHVLSLTNPINSEP